MMEDINNEYDFGTLPGNSKFPLEAADTFPPFLAEIEDPSKKKPSKEEFLESFKKMDAKTFVSMGTWYFGTEFYEYLSNKSFKDKLARKMFEEAIDADCWEYYRKFVRLYGVDALLRIYDGDTLSKINDDGHLYIVLASMLEIDANCVLERALVDNDFYKSLVKHSSSYYSLIRNIDYKILKEYCFKHFDFVINSFSLSNDDYAKLFSDDDIDNDFISKIIPKISNEEFISAFFTKDKRAFSVFKKLNKNIINYLIMENIRFSKEIAESDYMFEIIKDESIINFRNKVNKITLNNNYLEIEKKVCNYYIKLLNEYNPETGLFRIYEHQDETEFPLQGNYLVNYYTYKKSDDELRKITSRKISEIIVDYLFKDNIYNVFLNIRELLSYNESNENKLLSTYVVDFYRMILDIDQMSSDDKIKLFYRFKDYRIDELFYDNINSLRKLSYQELKNTVLHVEKGNINHTLSNKYQTNVYDYRDKEFIMLVRVLDEPFYDETRNKRECFSLISNNHTSVIHSNRDKKFIYGYNNFDINKVKHVYEHDAYSTDGVQDGERNIINRIYFPNELIDATSWGINEIQIVNKKENLFYRSIKPSYIIAIDTITDDIVNESKRLNIPIILINENNKKMVDRKASSRYGRNISDNPLEKGVLYRYTGDDAISNLEEDERAKKR